jgi:hypothetical protein
LGSRHCNTAAAVSLPTDWLTEVWWNVSITAASSQRTLRQLGIRAASMVSVELVMY